MSDERVLIVRALRFAAGDDFGGTSLEAFEDAERFAMVRVANRLEENLRSALPGAGRFVLLSPRQQEVVAMLVAGARVKEIAARLGLSTKTVDNHLHEIRSRVGVTSSTQVVLWALDNREAWTQAGESR